MSKSNPHLYFQGSIFSLEPWRQKKSFWGKKSSHIKSDTLRLKEVSVMSPQNAQVDLQLWKKVQPWWWWSTIKIRCYEQFRVSAAATCNFWSRFKYEKCLGVSLLYTYKLQFVHSSTTTQKILQFHNVWNLPKESHLSRAKRAVFVRNFRILESAPFFNLLLHKMIICVWFSSTVLFSVLMHNGDWLPADYNHTYKLPPPSPAR